MKARQKTWLRAALWLLVLLWMALIFRFSAQTADNSDQTSGGLIRLLLTWFDRGFLSLSPEIQQLRVESLSFVVRKSAHLCIFAGLGFLTFAAFSVDLPPRRAFPAAVGLGVLRAVLDEVHQSFVPGRSCELRDMCIDGAGVLLGAAVLLVLLRIIRRRNRAA